MLTPRAALLVGAALFSAPAFAQDTPQQVTPPPVLVTPAPAPAPAQTPPRVEMQPAAPVVQSVPSVAEQQRGVAAADAPAPAERRAATPTRTTRTTTTRTRTAQRAPAPAPAAQAPAPAPAAEAPAPAAQQPAPAAQQPAPAEPTVATAPAPEAAAPPTVTETTTAQENRAPGFAWPWLVGGVLLVLAGLAVVLFSRRRRTDEPFQVAETRREPAAREPVARAPVAREPVIEPVAAPVAEPVREPVAASAVTATEAEIEAEVAEADREDLAGIVETPAPVSHRPWIELGMRPVRAGTSDEEAMVDFELTVGNSGDTPARDVRITSFMLAEPEGTEMEALLTEHRDGTIVPPVTIPPGDGTRVDAHLAVPKGDLGRTFNPVVFAEARYTLPDGSEARTAAAFRIGRPSFEGGIGAIGSSRPHVVEDLAAELYGEPAHA